MAEVETLSPWWRRSAIIMIVAVLLRARMAREADLFRRAADSRTRRWLRTGRYCSPTADITAGQQVFLRYGLMENGTIWGHGAYIGPDFSADYLHTLAHDAEETVAERHGFVMQAALRPASD